MVWMPIGFHFKSDFFAWVVVIALYEMLTLGIFVLQYSNIDCKRLTHRYEIISGLILTGCIGVKICNNGIFPENMEQYSTVLNIFGAFMLCGLGWIDTVVE